MRNSIQVGVSAIRTICRILIIVPFVLAISLGRAGAQTLTTISSVVGGDFQGGLIQGSDGNFYGTTHFGGSHANCDAGCGQVFRVSSSGAYTPVHLFSHGADGAYGALGLMQGSDGYFYGSTYLGGLFKMTPAGEVKPLHTDIATALVQGNDGNIYGTTGSVFFKINPAGGVALLNTDFGNANWTLVQGGDSIFYGTTSGGGANSAGSVVQITTAGTVTTLYSFMGGADGGTPLAGLALGDDGYFYGTTSSGGGSSNGTVFKVTSAGALTTLNSFPSFTSFSPSNRLLVQGSDGNFYGTIDDGCGAVFQVTPAGTLTLYSFNNATNGCDPSWLVQGSDGNFYGTVLAGAYVFAFAVPLSPPPNQISTIQLAGTNLVLTIPSIAGETYQLQACDSLTSGTWSNVPGVSVTNSIGGLLTFTNFIGGSRPQEFYRFAIAIGNVTGAADDASEGVYSGGWTNGSNGGWGFGPWTLTLTSTNAADDGFFVGTSTNNAFGKSPGIDVGGISWGLYANTSNDATAYRGFASLATGSVFSVSMDNGFIDPGNSDGFVLRNGNVTTNYNTNARFEFLFLGGGNSYAVVDASGYNPIGVTFTGTGLRLVFTLGTNDTYNFTVIDNASGATDTNITGTLAGTPGSTIDSVALYNRNAGSGPANDAFFNALQITGP